MKQYLPLLVIPTLLFGCSPEEKYAQYGLKGDVKTVIETEYTQVANMFGEWVPADTTEHHEYMIKRYDTNGNMYRLEFHKVLSVDYAYSVLISSFNNQKLIRSYIYNVLGTLTDSETYNYLSENTYTQTDYDSTGKADRITSTKIDNHRRPLFYHVTKAADSTTLITEEFDYHGDTTFITYADKVIGKIEKLKKIVVKKDDKGNPITIITIPADTSDAKPAYITIRKYEYYH